LRRTPPPAAPAGTHTLRKKEAAYDTVYVCHASGHASASSNA
jgi:hypothetical protein